MSAVPAHKQETLRVFKSIGLREQGHQGDVEQIRKSSNLPAALARVLAARGFSNDASLEQFLEPTLKRGLEDPKKLGGLSDAAALISKHIEANDPITVCCDFDVDGLTGGSLLCIALRQLGAKAEVLVPDRFQDGYGLNAGMVSRAIDQGAKLLICVDYGTTNATEIEVARAAGLSTIVIDHHEVGDHNPGADVFVNPKQSGCGFAEGTLCAAGLVWYLLIALKKHFPELDPREYLDLACLGTICDMVPLRGVNRVIAKRGLERLSKTRRPGLVALRNILSITSEVRSSHVGFGFGPRINAAGRLAHGSLVVELLTTSDSARAQKLANKLNQLNFQRQEIEEQVKLQAEEIVNLSGGLPSSLCIWGEDFHTGVVGIVAQRLVENYHRPSVVLGKDGESFKGSVRGIRGFNVVDALSRCSDLLEKFGGHEAAGGLSLPAENLPLFAEAFEEVAKDVLNTDDYSPSSLADTELTLKEFRPELLEQLKTFEPHGIGNPAPVFLLRDLEVRKVQVLKNRHLKVVLGKGNDQITALWWRCNSHPAISEGATIHVTAKLDKSTFQGATNLQLILQAAEPA